MTDPTPEPTFTAVQFDLTANMVEKAGFSNVAAMLRFAARRARQTETGELSRLRAENERLTRLVETQRPELRALRNVEVALRDLAFHVGPRLTEVHAQAAALLPAHDDDLPSLTEIRGILSDQPDSDPEDR